MAPIRLEFRVLGPLEVAVDGVIVEIGSRKQRMLSCALAAEPGRAVPADTLVEVLWAGVPPVSADVTLRGLVSRLRRALGPAGNRLVTSRGGYLLRLAADEVDAARFTRLVERGRDDVAIGRPDQAVVALRAALGLWRGEPLADLKDSEFGQALAARLDDARAAVTEELAGAELAAGRPDAAVDLLGPHLAAYPLREPGWGHLMLALYRLGRQADALAAYRRVRGILREDLGVEPSPVLRRLQNQILVQDPGLDLMPADRSPGSDGFGLPAALSPMVGRGEDLLALTAVLADTRLLTLTGVGGVGKTRLALQLAADQLELWDAVQLVELAPLAPDGRVDLEVARRLGVAGPDGALRHLAEYLSGRRVLLVLDNCEHVLDEAARVAETLLSHCPDLTVLATSREPLAVGAEVLWPVQPLSLPPAGSCAPSELADSAAVMLFCQRARESQVGFRLTPDNAEDVLKICRRLDGIPLALELAAARLRALPTRQIAARLDDRFALLTAGSRTALPRHQTLRATMDWSYQLLAPADQAGLRALTVFPTDFDLAAATAVIGPADTGGTAEDLLFRLVDKSLVQTRHHDGEARYRMLETVQAFGAERLAEAGEQSATRRRHRDHYCRLAAGWRASRFMTAAWSRRVAIDEENLRTAVANALVDADGDAARQLLSGLWPYWTWTGRREAAEWLERALELDGNDLLARAEVAMGLGLLLVLWELAPRTRAAELIDSALVLADEADDDGCRSWAHFIRGELLSFGGDRAEARTEYLTGLGLIQQPARAAAFHHALGWVALAEDNPAAAGAEFEMAIAYGAEGDVHVAHAQAALAVLLAMAGECSRAVPLAGEAVATARRFPLPEVLVMALVRAAQTFLLCGDNAMAADALLEVFTLLHRLGTRPFRAEALEATALLAHRVGDDRLAIERLAAAAALRDATAEAGDIDVLGPDLSNVRATAMTTFGTASSRFNVTTSSSTATTSATPASSPSVDKLTWRPSTAADSTRRRASGLHASIRRVTWAANERGAGRMGSQLFHRCVGTSGEQSRDVERISTGVLAQSARRPGGDLAHPQELGQLRDLRRKQRLQFDHGAGPTGGQPAQARREALRILRTQRHDDQYPGAEQSAGHEQQRAQGIQVGPVRIVHHDDDGRCCLEVLHGLEHPLADADRLLGGQRPLPIREQPGLAHGGGTHQLVDHAEGNESLPLFAGCAHRDQVGFDRQQSIDQGRFADPARAFQQHEAQLARAGDRQLPPELLQFDCATHE